jgi:beta-phosphoglucomutase-like phosphatase (HAD superfamily)
MNQRVCKFDVEGTLIDCAPQILRCWAGTFSLRGRDVGTRFLQAFSGMDGSDMLRRLAPDLSAKERMKILKIQQDRYDADYLMCSIIWALWTPTQQRHAAHIESLSHGQSREGGSGELLRAVVFTNGRDRNWMEGSDRPAG